jgi:hypothetical protein
MNNDNKYLTWEEFKKSLREDPLYWIFAILILILLPIILWFWDGTIPFYCGLSVFLD